MSRTAFLSSFANRLGNQEPPEYLKRSPEAEEAYVANHVLESIRLLESRLRKCGQMMSAPQDVRQFCVLHMAALKQEQFFVMFLNANHAMLEFRCMFTGTLTQTSVYPREVVRASFELNASAVILAHNHPSGNCEPSRADELLTKVLRQSLALIDVRVLDHVIVGGVNTLSFAERGLL